MPTHLAWVTAWATDLAFRLSNFWPMPKTQNRGFGGWATESQNVPMPSGISVGCRGMGTGRTLGKGKYSAARNSLNYRGVKPREDYPQNRKNRAVSTHFPQRSSAPFDGFEDAILTCVQAACRIACFAKSFTIKSTYVELCGRGLGQTSFYSLQYTK